MSWLIRQLHNTFFSLGLFCPRKCDRCLRGKSTLSSTNLLSKRTHGAKINEHDDNRLLLLLKVFFIDLRVIFQRLPKHDWILLQLRAVLVTLLASKFILRIWQLFFWGGSAWSSHHLSPCVIYSFLPAQFTYRSTLRFDCMQLHKLVINIFPRICVYEFCALIVGRQASNEVVGWFLQDCGSHTHTHTHISSHMVHGQTPLTDTR